MLKKKFDSNLHERTICVFFKKDKLVQFHAPIHIHY